MENEISKLKLSSNVEVIEERADHRIVDRATIWETQDVKSKELTEGELININEERGFDKKDEDVPEEEMLANNLNIKEALRDILWHWKHEG